MADNYPVPPPPPQAHKPVPPPPPRMAGSGSLAPQGSPNSPLTSPAMTPPAAVQPPVARGPMPTMPGAMPGMPPFANSGPSQVEQRLQEMEKRYQDQEASRKTADAQMEELKKQLKDEQEKVLLQSLRAKEEETLSIRVEQQLREMQDKLRREKHEQDLHESRNRAESQIKELERRINEERASWMLALKNQLKEREVIEQDVEKNLTRRLREADEHYQNEKSQWTAQLRQKEEELLQLKRQIEVGAETAKGAIEKKEEELETLREETAEQKKTLERQMQAELRALQAQIDHQTRDVSSSKAQVALLQNQIQASESQRQEDRARANIELKRREEDIRKEYAQREDDTKRREEEMRKEFAQREEEKSRYWEQQLTIARAEKEDVRKALATREEEKVRYWEGVLTQERLDKEALRKSYMTLQEEVARMQTEKSAMRLEMENVRQSARQEALMHLPEVYEQRLVAERKKWDQEHAPLVQQLKNQLMRSLEEQKALAAQSEMERQRAQQDVYAIQDQLQNQMKEKDSIDAQSKEYLQRIAELQMRANEMIDAHQAAETALQEKHAEELAEHERQNKQYLQRIAELQMRENGLRDEHRTVEDTLQAQQNMVRQLEESMENMKDELRLAASRLDAAERLETDYARLKAEKQALEQRLNTATQAGDELEDTRQENKELILYKTQTQKELVDLRRGMEAMARAQVEWKNTVAQLQAERNQHEQDWSEKEKAWAVTKAECDKTIAELEGARVEAMDAAQRSPAGTGGGPVAISPETLQAVGAIRQQMQEMQALLAWLRPGSRQSFPKAA